MANYAVLKAAINAVIKTNGNKEITGQVLNQTLMAIVDSLGENYQFAGVAVPSTNPGTPDQNIFYLATQAGTYTNFGATVLPAGISMLEWKNNTWSSETFFTIDDAPTAGSDHLVKSGGVKTAIDNVAFSTNEKVKDVGIDSTPTSGSDNLIKSGAVFDAFKNDGGAYDVSVHFPTGGVEGGNTYTLDGAIAMVPQNMKKGGMSIKFVSSSDNNYVQYRLMSDTFNTTPANWQGVDAEPINGSKNLVESGGVTYALDQRVANSRSGNLIDKNDSDYKTNYYINALGAEQSGLSSKNAVTGYIPIKEGEIMKISQAMTGGYLALYDINKTFIQGSAVKGNEQPYIIGTSESKYARFTLYNANNEYSVEIVSSISDSVTFDGEWYNPIGEYLEDYVTKKELSNVSVKIREKVDINNKGGNLVNKEDINYIQGTSNNGAYINALGQVQDGFWDSKSSVSGFIPISEGEILKTSGAVAGRYAALYTDENESSYINGSAVDLGSQLYIIGTASSKYARFTLYANENKYVVKEVSETTDIVEYTGESNPVSGYISDYLKNGNFQKQLISLNDNKVNKSFSEDGNLIDETNSEFLRNYYINGLGQAVQHPNNTKCAVTNFIPISEGEILKINQYLVGGYLALYTDKNESSYINGSAVNGSSQQYLIGTASSKYARFTLYNADLEFAVKKVRNVNDVVEYDGKSNPISGYLKDYATKEDLNEAKSEGYADIIVCDGDSLTWGDLGSYDQNEQSAQNFPAILQAYLGGMYKVINSGVPGAQSTTIVGNATGFRVRTAFTIPATATPVDFSCCFFRDITDVDAWAYGPIISHHDVRGCINPAYICGVKGTLGYHYTGPEDTDYKATFTREKAGDSVSVGVDEVVFTQEMRFKDATRVIFAGANKGWFLKSRLAALEAEYGEEYLRSHGAIIYNDSDNIAELVNQIKMVKNVSNDKYIVISYHNWQSATGIGVWSGESVFNTEFGNHYINLRQYMSTDAITDAIARGYLPDDGTYPTTLDTTRMSEGRTPPSLMSADGVHLTDVGYHLLGDLVFNKYKELVKKQVLGTLI